ncbi:MAG: B12-binding domain-containing radical SAM protein [bacterium]|nr:B12-binding domain-containing radical SAM protein [bacterium]
MPNALLIYPKNPVTFWSFDEALEMIDKKSAFPPLGLLTIAGMIPDEYQLRLVDINIRDLEDADLDWADVVITSSMIIHWHPLEEVMARCNARGVPVINGGPLPTQYYDRLEGDAVFYLGEAENGFMDVVNQMVADPQGVKREIIDRRGEFQNLSQTPLPRWDLIDFKDYSSMVLQMTRGCPESCTFCNIPSLYGKVTRIKEKSHLIQELDALYDAGWRGALMAVDDNLVGNREEIRVALEEEVIPWQQARGYPFQLHTQVSIRLSDDDALLQAMRLAGFDKVFVGIESPVEESLKFMGAQKNLQGTTSLMDKVRKLQKTGFEVQAGFIMGLDTDPDDIADRMIAFIQEAGIPVAMVGILGVLRDTPDYKRFKRLGRLVEDTNYTGDSGIFNRELSFKPLIDPDELLDRHRHVVETLNSPEVFFERSLTHFEHQGPGFERKSTLGMTEVKAFFRSMWRQGIRGTYRKAYWSFLAQALKRYPSRFPDAVRLAVQGHHLILTTRQALQVDEVKTFMDEALEHLDRLCQGTQEVLQRSVEPYGSKLMQALHYRLEHVQNDYQTLQQNADVFKRAAHEYCETVREEFRHMVRGPLERFLKELEDKLEEHRSMTVTH